MIENRLTYETYSKDRLERALNRYSGRADCYRTWYLILAITSAICTITIPAGALLSKINSDLVIYLGIVNAFALGLLTIFRCNEKWRLYRLTCGKVKQEKYLYLAQSGDYNKLDDQERLALLVKNVETILNEKNTEWSELVEQTNSDK